MEDIVTYEKKDRIAYILLNRPDKLNALTINMANKLTEIWKDFRDDEKCLVAIISGSGKAFCGGAAVEGLASGKWSLSQSITLGEPAVGPKKHKVYKPIIAALHGYVIGGGFWLALECDLRVAADNTLFSLPEPKIGIPTSFAAFLSDYVPRGIAAELLLTGNMINAQRAYQLGIVNKVVSSGDLMASATSLAERICANAPLAVQAIKEVMIKSKGMNFRNALKLTEKIYAPVYSSIDAKEGKNAFKEKRKPKWKGK